MHEVIMKIKEHRAANWFGTVARLVIGIVWLAAGFLKAFNPYSAGAAVRAYEIFPPDLATTIGHILPWVEIGIGLLLILGLYVRLSAVASAVLFIAFIAGISSAWARGLTIDCGCFGGGGTVEAGQTKYLEEIVRDLGLTLLALYLVWRPKSRWAMDRRDQIS